MRGVALPPEHGAWGFLSEALIVGLIAAASPAAFAVAAAGLALFLLRQPFKVVLADRLQRGRLFPRTRVALAFAAAYGGAAGIALFAAGGLAAGAGWVVPFLIALPAGLFQLRAELKSDGRALLPELLGACAAGALASSCALASGWPAGAAAVPWVLLASRAAATIVYARTRLRLDRGVPASRLPAWGLHGAGLAISGVLASVNLAPKLAALVFSLLLGRALWSLGPMRRPIRPRRLGWQEMALGVGSAFAFALGFRLGL